MKYFGYGCITYLIMTVALCASGPVFPKTNQKASDCLDYSFLWVSSYGIWSYQAGT